MRTKLNTLLVAGLLLAGAQLNLHAQLVADGSTTNVTTAIDLSPGNLTVGNTGGNTTLNVIAPGTVTNATGYIGLTASSDTNTVTVQNSGAIWNNTGELHVGESGAANQLIVSNGAVVVSTANAYSGGAVSSSNNTVHITGTNSLLDCDANLTIGQTGSNNRLTIQNGGSVSSFFSTVLGGMAGARGNEIVVSDPGSQLLPRSQIRIGNSGSENFLLITNGGTVKNSTALFGFNSFSSNNLAVVTGPGSAWTNTLSLLIGQLGPGNKLRLQDSGFASSGGATILGDLASSVNNLLHLDGGVLDVGTTLDVRRGTLQLDSGTASVGTLLATNGANSTILFNGGTLSVNNSTVNNGFPLAVGNGSSSATLQLLGTDLHSFNNGLTLASNAQLIGNGTVSGTLTVQAGGIVAPGTSPGWLVLSNSPVLQGNVVMEISKTGGTLTNDLIQVAGAITYGGTLTVTDLGPDPLVDGDSFQLFDATSYEGAGFANVILPALDPWLSWTNRLLDDGSIAVMNGLFTPVTIPNLGGVFFGSVAWGDYDNDGRLDFLLTGATNIWNGTSQLWRNTGSGFTNVTSAVTPGLPGVTQSSAAWGDYDNDGRLDFFLTGWTNVFAEAVSQLWRNTGSGFTNVTDTAFPGNSLLGLGGSSVAWGDYDNDGRLDLLLLGTPNDTDFVSQLWRNTGSGFTNVTDTQFPTNGLPGMSYGSVTWADYDNDGRLDFLIMGYDYSTFPNELFAQLWRNTGSGFTNVTDDVLTDLPAVSDASVAWGDYDADGNLDFLLTGLSDSNVRVSQLWRNTGSEFTNVTSGATPGLPGVWNSSVAWGDYDNDGRLDLFLAGWTNGISTGVSQLWRNTGSGFTNVTDTAFPGNSLSGLGWSSVAWGDYDNDGRLDFLLTGYTGSTGISQLWRNNTQSTNTPPAAPTGLALTATTNAVMLSWNSATDDFTPATGLTYNVRAGTTPGGIDLFAGHVNPTNGFRRVPAMGNANLRHSLPLTGVTNGQTVYWSVQAVDTSFAGGPFATETSVVTIPTLFITTNSQPSTMNISWTPPTWGWFLQEAPTVSGTWSDSPSGEENPTTVPTTNGATFYRLINP